MQKRVVLKITLIACLCTIGATPLPAQTFNSLLSFFGTNGSLPIGSLVQGLDGNFYGVTRTGGSNGAGTVFRVSPEGQQTTLHSFDGSDGESPYGLSLATDGNFYGTTFTLGPNGHGTVFKITPGGTLTTIYSFCAEGGECAETGTNGTGIIQGHDGNLYGTTFQGGVGNYGILYKLTLGGAFTALASFDLTDGSNPYAALVQNTAGDFWGATFGGTSNDGVVYKYSSGALTAVFSFDGSDGNSPDEYGALVQDASGNFYGMTGYGGAFSTCGYPENCGTIFKVTPGGTLTTIHSFSNAEGAGPSGGLTYGTDGNLYGDAEGGGNDGYGTLFKTTTGGTLTALHSFVGTDGRDPIVTMVQGTNGIFYGTTYAGGTDDDGTVFSLSVGLSPFVKTVPIYGAVGTTVFVLGTDLTGATKVTFDGVSATFTVVSATEITTKVPTAAKTGTVRVSTPRGTLSSNVSFFVP